MPHIEQLRFRRNGSPGAAVDPTVADPIRIFDRPGLALARALEGDIGAAGRALVAPSTLTISERRSLVASLIGEKEVDSTYGKILGALTNPLVIVGAVLAIRYPVLSVRNMTKLASRLGGYNRAVGSISRWVGGLDDTFRGTAIPGLFRGLARAIHGHRAKYIGDGPGGLTTLLTRFKATAGREITSAESYRVAMKLNGLDQMGKGAPGRILARQLGLPYVVKPIQLSRAEQQLYATLKQDWMPEHYAVIKTVGKEGLGQLRGDGLVIASGAKKIEHYWPRMLTRRPADELRDIVRMPPHLLKKVTTVHAKDRHNAMLPSREEMELIDQAHPGQFHPKFRKSLADEIHARDARFRLDSNTYQPAREYTMNLIPTLEKYSNSVARVHGWHGTPEKYGAAILREETIARAAGPNGIVKANMLRDVYVPWAQGRQTHDQGVKAAAWVATKANAVDRLYSLIFTKLIPETWRKKLIGMIEDPATSLSADTVGSNLAGMFYVSALGGNVRSATTNLMQTLLTTYPAIGARWTGRGIESTFIKGSKYFKLRAGGVEAETALTRAFPEFADAGLTNLSTIHESIGPALDGIWQVGRRAGTKTGGAGAIKHAKDALMAMFSTTEKFNRLTAFEGARLKALSEGMRGTSVLDFAAGVMEQTQFVPTLTGTPFGLIGVNPLVKQFVTFGTKHATALAQNVAGFVRGDAQRAGQLGRQLLGGGLLYEGAKRFLDIDVSHGLMFGALPKPHHASPLGVIPFTPPVIGIAASALKSVLDEDLAPIAGQVPLMIPGGVALARAIGPLGGRVLPQTVVRGVSEFIGREYADYDHPGPDGRIPLYTQKGQLKGHLSPTQLLMRAAGVPVGDLQRESELMGIMIRQREQMRVTKRAWLNAYQGNDEPAQRDIAEQYKAQFGIDIPIKKADIRRIELRRDIPRLEMMLRTLPREARPQFSAILGTALSASAGTLVDGERGTLGYGSDRTERGMGSPRGLRSMSRATAPGTLGYAGEGDGF